MSGRSPIEPGAQSLSVPTAQEWQVRPACHDDVGAVASAVGELLLELGGTPTSMATMKDAAQSLVDDEQAGALLVADVDGTIVGVLGASWQVAIHAAGRYGLIQDLWVHPSWRGTGIGRDLVLAFVELACELDVVRLEVGLPSERFPRLRETELFYRRYGFSPLGVRMRRDLR